MADLGLVYDAMHVPVTSYFSDSGGGWSLTGDPLQEELSSGRAQILMHPIHWREEPRIYFFLSTARSGSTWVSEVLDRATPFESRHEFTLNHEFEQGNPVASKRTRDDLNELLDDPDEVQRLLAGTRDWLEENAMDYAEPNVYLAHFLDQLRVEFPDAELVFLHRHPARVVRSLVNRDWYDSPDDHRHPVVDIDGWEELDQLSKVCWYVRAVNQELMVLPHRVSLERMTRDIQTLSQELERLGIPFYPVLAGDVLAKPLNTSQTYDYPSYDGWDAREKAAFEQICRPVCQALSYGIDGCPPASISAKRSPAETERRAETVYTERTLFALESVPRRRTDAWRMTCLGVLSKLENLARRVGARSTAPMERLWSGWKPHQRPWFLGRGCHVDMSAPSPTVQFSESTTHAHVVVGGGEWYRLPAGRGWPATLGSWYRGEIEIEGDIESPVILYCLMYDRQGQQVYRRSLVQLSNHQPRRRFRFKTRRFADRFCLALYFPASDQRRAVKLLGLKLEERSITAMPSPEPHRSFGEPRRLTSPAAAERKSRPLPARVLRIAAHFQKYRTYVARLISDIVLRFRFESAIIFVLTTSGIALIGAGFVSALQFLKSLGAGEPLTVWGREVPIQNAELLFPISVGVGALFAIGALLQYVGRRKTIALMGKYERLCIARTVSGVSRVVVPLSLPSGVTIGPREIGSFIGRIPRVCGRLTMIMFSVVRDIVIFLFALGGIFYINPSLSLIVLGTVVLAAPFLYSNNLYAIAQTKRFDRAAKPAMTRKRGMLDDVMKHLTPLPPDSGSLSSHLSSGPLDEHIRAFGGRLLSLERSILITTILAGILFLEIVLLMGSQLSEDDTAWANLLGFVVALQFFALSLTRAVRGLTSITRFYPWVNPFHEFLAALSELAGTETERPALLASRVESLDPARPDALRLRPGEAVEVVTPAEFDRLVMSVTLDELSAGAIRNTWCVQNISSDNALTVREFFGVPTELDLQAVAHASSLPARFAELDLSTRMLDQRVSDLPLLPCEHQAVIGTLACMASGSDAVFYLGQLWEKLSVECRRWIEQVLASRFIFVVHRAAEYSPDGGDGAVVLVDGSKVVGWCSRAHLEAHPEVYRTLTATAVRAQKIDMDDDEEEAIG